MALNVPLDKMGLYTSSNGITATMLCKYCLLFFFFFWMREMKFRKIRLFCSSPVPLVYDRVGIWISPDAKIYALCKSLYWVSKESSVDWWLVTLGLGLRFTVGKLATVAMKVELLRKPVFFPNLSCQAGYWSLESSAGSNSSLNNWNIMNWLILALLIIFYYVNCLQK